VSGAARPTRADQTGLARFLALGDSYTIGEGVAPRGSWPAQLVDLLRTSGHSIADPEIIARTGWTSGELLQGIAETPPAGKYDLVSLLIGVNNQYRGNPADVYTTEFQQLLELAIGYAGGDPARVIVVSIPDWSVTPFAAEYDAARVSSEVDSFNALNRAAARRHGTGYVDVTPISRTAPERAGLLVSDQLHPSAAMYAEWARLIEPVAARALTESRPAVTDIRTHA